LKLESLLPRFPLGRWRQDLEGSAVQETLSTPAGGG